MEIIGKGDNSCVFRGFPRLATTFNIKCDVLVTKVMHNAELFNEQIEIAKNLQDLDPSQDFLLYPIAWSSQYYGSEFNLLCSFPIQTTYHHIMQLPYGGITLKSLVKNKITFTETQSRHLIYGLHDCIEKLHINKLSHGDLHSGNIVINDNMEVHLIDIDHKRTIIQDIEDFSTHVMHEIGNLTEPGDFSERLKYNASKNRSMKLTLRKALESIDREITSNYSSKRQRLNGGIKLF